MLPDQSGLELTRAIKRNKDTEDMPVIMLTARAEEHDKIAGLEGGADDYVTKPFSPRELLARINAVLRRSSVAGAGDTLDADGLVLDPRATASRLTDRRCRSVRRSTDCSVSSWSTRSASIRAARSSIGSGGGNVYVEERTVDVHIRRLRKALEPFGRDGLVQTVRGAGYRFSTRPD